MRMSQPVGEDCKVALVELTVSAMRCADDCGKASSTSEVQLVANVMAAKNSSILNIFFISASL